MNDSVQTAGGARGQSGPLAARGCDAGADANERRDVISARFLAGMQVLVVDDDKSLLQALTKVLRQLGARVLAADSVSSAVACLTRGTGPLHLVLTDMRMPLVSGKLVLSAVRGSMRGVPVIVMSAFATPAMRDECSALGAAAFIEKPFDVSLLTSLLRRVLDESQSASV